MINADVLGDATSYFVWSILPFQPHFLWSAFQAKYAGISRQEEEIETFGILCSLCTKAQAALTSTNQQVSIALSPGTENNSPLYPRIRHTILPILALPILKPTTLLHSINTLE